MLEKPVFAPSCVEFIASIINRSEICDVASVCDLGARDEVLYHFLDKKINYVGIDIYPTGCHSYYSDIEKKIQLDQNFDCVTAIDVMEHTNDIQTAITNSLEITDNLLLINLPNELFIINQIKLMFGSISGKYKVNLSSKDRHRWFFTQRNVEDLVEQLNLNASKVTIIPFYQKSRVLGKIFYLLSPVISHSLLAKSFLIIIEK